MASNVTIREAAISLTEQLTNRTWFRMVGISASRETDAILIVYTKNASKPARESVPKIWEGYEVRVASMSDPTAVEKKHRALSSG